VASLKKLQRLDLREAGGYTDEQLAKTVDELPELQTVACSVAYKPRHLPTSTSKPMLEPTPEQRTQIESLIAKLGDQFFETRLAAKRDLLRIGAAAEGQLCKARDESSDSEVRDLAGKLLIAVTNPFRNAKVGDWACYSHPFPSQFGFGGETKYVVTKVTETEVTLDQYNLQEPGSKPRTLTIKFEESNRYLYLREQKVKELGTAEETITVNGKDFHTRCDEFETTLPAKEHDELSNYKIWVNTDLVPLDGMVKYERDTGGRKLIIELKDYGREK
jgi:hypothetical protein